MNRLVPGSRNEPVPFSYPGAFFTRKFVASVSFLTDVIQLVYVIVAVLFLLLWILGRGKSL